MQNLNGLTKKEYDDSPFLKSGYFADEILLLTYHCYECKAETGEISSLSRTDQSIRHPADP